MGLNSRRVRERSGAIPRQFSGSRQSRAIPFKIPMMETALESIIRQSELDPAACVLRHVTSTSRLIVAAFDAALRPAGLTGHQFNLLMTLARSGPMNVNSLAAAVGMHPSTTPRVTAPLARCGLIRTQADTDRRVRIIAITRKGSGRLVRAYPYWAEVQRDIVKRLGDQEWLCAMGSLKDIRKSLEESPASQSRNGRAIADKRRSKGRG
jgi:DNA-binding MarR family transcriptional regulator